MSSTENTVSVPNADRRMRTSSILSLGTI